MTEYQKNVIRMWDSIRAEENKGDSDCEGVDCIDCPFNGEVCYSGDSIMFHMEKCGEIVNNWVQDHPLITYEDKFKEVFGVKPVYIESEVESNTCPKLIGFGIGIECSGQPCRVCKLEFWQSEYKQPKVDEEANT